MTILLATHNGSPWLEQQLHSLFGQREVDVAIVAGDDRSRDATPALLAAWASRAALRCLPESQEVLGNANRNFLRLIRESPISDAQFIALADQDDIWAEDKLRRAVTCITEMSLDAYSSDVTAFWPDGREMVIHKSQPLRRHDHLFESAGPGCTFVFRRAAFERLRNWIDEHIDELREVKVHDWLIYAYARRHGWAWHIDDQSYMRYRQHERNEIGANTGWKAITRRLRSAFSGAFRQDALAIADAVEDDSWVSQALRRFQLVDRIRLAAGSGQMRRRWRDRFVLALLFLVMRRGSPRQMVNPGKPGRAR